MKPFQSVDEKILQNGAFLIDKKTKQKISPTSVRSRIPMMAERIQSVAFFFPKKSDTGISTIFCRRKYGGFCERRHQREQKASFDISKMTDTVGRDL